MLSVAPVTGDPARLSTGSDSPVSIDSSTADAPERTTPSTGTLSPGRTRKTSPRRTVLDGDEPLDAVGIVGVEQANLLGAEPRELAQRLAGAGPARWPPRGARAGGT